MCHDQRVIGALLHYQDEHGVCMCVRVCVCVYEYYNIVYTHESIMFIRNAALTNTLSTIKSYPHSQYHTRKESGREGDSSEQCCMSNTVNVLCVIPAVGS